VDITDVRITGKELEYWKKASKEYIPDAEFEEHRSRSLEKRIANFKLVYCIVGLLYVAIAFACYNYPSILHNLIVK
jgi:type IV secretory pathway component VirB8